METPLTNFATFRDAVSVLNYGKRLPGAVYILRPKQGDVSPELLATICRAEAAAHPDPSWNLLKIHTDQFALTFLSYPNFDTDPHPALADATKVNLNTGSVSRTDYRLRSNPPILHRKETFLPPNDPRVLRFAALTRHEEEAGLYRDPSRIGLRLQWLTLLKRLRLVHEDHALVSVGKTQKDLFSENDELAEVDRHRTAIKRF
jgi:DNA phosphorothioation-associated putative methyltransferase